MFFYAILAILLVIAYFIANKVGKYRHIGFIWTFFFCFTLTPVLGYIICIASPLKTQDKRLRGPTILSFFLILLASCGLIWCSIVGLALVFDPAGDEIPNEGIAYSIGAIGFLGALIYELILTFSGGKNYRGRNLRG